MTALVSSLHLAATPTFAAMAALTALGGGPADMLCAAAPGAPLAATLSGMTAMYLLMSAFHAAPWLELLARGGPLPRPTASWRRSRRRTTSRSAPSSP